MKQKLVFFFPWHEVSGGPYFLTRLADGAAKTEKFEVYYTDYRYGLSDTLITDPRVKTLEYRDEGRNFRIFPDEPVVVVMPIYWAFMVPVMHPDSKIVFFNWHNECIPCLKRDWCLTDKGIRAFLLLVKQTSSVFFCDRAHWMAQNTADITFKETYVPIVIPERNVRATGRLAKENERTIAIMGRLCIDKVFSVLDVIDSVIGLRDQKKTTIYIIGDGDQNFRILNRTYPSHVKVLGCGTMKMENIIPMLTKKVDILFAMGTSVLDGASIGIPSVVIPNSMKEFRCNQYPYLYETKGYALGWYPEQIDDMGITTHTIREIFDDIYGCGRKGEIGRKCYEYYLEKHTENEKLFEAAISDSTLTYGQFCDFRRTNRSIRQIVSEMWRKMKTACGVLWKQFSIFGIPLCTIRFREPCYYNVFVFGFPLLRFEHTNLKFSVHLLAAVWGLKAIKKVLQACGLFRFTQKESSYSV